MILTSFRIGSQSIFEKIQNDRIPFAFVYELDTLWVFKHGQIKTIQYDLAEFSVMLKQDSLFRLRDVSFSKTINLQDQIIQRHVNNNLVLTMANANLIDQNKTKSIMFQAAETERTKFRDLYIDIEEKYQSEKRRRKKLQKTSLGLGTILAILGYFLLK